MRFCLDKSSFGEAKRSQIYVIFTGLTAYIYTEDEVAVNELEQTRGKCTADGASYPVRWTLGPVTIDFMLFKLGNTSYDGMFVYVWEYSELLTYIGGMQHLQDPLEDERKVNFNCTCFNGNWVFGIKKEGRGQDLVIYANYYKDNAPLVGNFEVELGIVHGEDILEVGKRSSGEIRKSNEKPIILTVRYGNIRYRWVKYTTRFSYYFEWKIPHGVVAYMMNMKKSPDVTFTFQILARKH